jgi:ribosomal protein S18 acetylase RimI-like enzyme
MKELIQLKKVEKEDNEKLIKLAKEFIEFNTSSHPLYARANLETTYKGNSEWYKELIEEKSELYFILSDGLEVGYMLLEIKELDDAETYNPGKVGLIDELYITGDYRMNGLGTYAIREAEKILKEIGCKVIRIAHFDWNTAGDLYKNLGFSSFSHTLEKQVI